MNLPNALTVTRIFLVPLLVVVLLTKFEGHALVGVPTPLVGAAIVLLIAFGWMLTTESGLRAAVRLLASVTLTPRARSSATVAATSETRTAKANPPPPARRVAWIAGQAGPKPAWATP